MSDVDGRFGSVYSNDVFTCPPHMHQAQARRRASLHESKGAVTSSTSTAAAVTSSAICRIRVPTSGSGAKDDHVLNPLSNDTSPLVADPLTIASARVSYGQSCVASSASVIPITNGAISGGDRVASVDGSALESSNLIHRGTTAAHGGLPDKLPRRRSSVMVMLDADRRRASVTEVVMSSGSQHAELSDAVGSGVGHLPGEVHGKESIASAEQQGDKDRVVGGGRGHLHYVKSGRGFAPGSKSSGKDGDGAELLFDAPAESEAAETTVLKVSVGARLGLRYTKATGNELLTCTLQDTIHSSAENAQNSIAASQTAVRAQQRVTGQQDIGNDRGSYASSVNTHGAKIQEKVCTQPFPDRHVHSAFPGPASSHTLN
jgi:hypothetical protein